MKYIDNIFKNRYINTNPYSYIVFGFILIFMVFFFVFDKYNRKCYDKCVFISATLGDVRKRIDLFHNINGRYPVSLGEFRQVSSKYPYSLSIERMFVNLTSGMQKDVPEYRELNNQGGYYYNPETGEIRFNLTKPVKEYLPFYFGRFRNHIPSEW